MLSKPSLFLLLIFVMPFSFHLSGEGGPQKCFNTPALSYKRLRTPGLVSASYAPNTSRSVQLCSKVQTLSDKITAESVLNYFSAVLAALLTSILNRPCMRLTSYTVITVSAPKDKASFLSCCIQFYFIFNTSFSDCIFKGNVLLAQFTLSSGGLTLSIFLQMGMFCNWQLHY